MDRLSQFFCLLFFLLSTLNLSAQQPRPNIIIILTDDQRWDALGAMGNPLIQTPNLDQLANEASLFHTAFVTTPICAASRASIMTGMYERRHGFTFRTPPLQRKFVDVSYPSLLKQTGYQVAFFGKFGMQYEDDLQKEIF
ncbi:MAG: sulfatase-like hydrolase/transferase, partial [Bacteroidota bacterium]